MANDNNKNGGMISDFPMYIFTQGENYESYKMLGAHPCKGENGEDGYLFAVWAPNAKSVSVVCDANGWRREDGYMFLHTDFGIWERFIEGAKPGENYKYSIETQSGEIILKADPYAFFSEVRPANASVTTDLSYDWHDEKWLKTRSEAEPYSRPISIYETHLGSWKTHEDGSLYNYREMADELVSYLVDMGYTHIEIMPICEYPFDGSWGYQVTGYYSVNSRYGSPTDFKYFVDKCHEAGIGVIMDWVPAHFPKDAFGLAKFDGTCLYEHPDSRRGEHYEWGTLIFNWEKSEIFSFLISNAIFWLSEYHLDGLRVDAVSSMLYLDYNRRDGEWLPNKYGGKENIEAIEFFRKLNSEVFRRFPNTLMIAEESTAWGGVTHPVHEGGLGFNFKWNMGWMNDILKYMSMDPYFRRFNHNLVTFSFMYAFSENYILALSHDEVVHGKKSLIEKMYGTYEEKFAGLRLFYAYMFAHPGKKLLFMGDDIAQFIEWRYYEGLDWQLLDYDMHRKFNFYCKTLNEFYKSQPALYENEQDWNGFQWINANDDEHSIISFVRYSKEGKDSVICVANFTPVGYNTYTIGVPSDGIYSVVLNTNDEKFGGDGAGSGKYMAKKESFGDFEYSIKITVPALTSIYLKKGELAHAPNAKGAKTSKKA